MITRSPCSTSRARRLIGILCAAVAAFVLAAPASAPAAQLVPVGDFAEPIYVTAPPDDERRLFVVQRGGRIKVVKDGVTLDRRFLKIPGGVSTDGERGLLSMAFHPKYADNGRFYVYYTNGSGDIRIDEFKRRKGDKDEARGGSQRKVLRVEHSQFANHNGGQLQFGSDGRLYIATGDGGGANDPPGNGQDLDTLLGKLLRINPKEQAGEPYRIPDDNPFKGRAGQNEIFAYGLRNPFRFSFDRITGDLAIGDVGENVLEEVDFRSADAPGGANFGWVCFEGTRQNTEASPRCAPPNHVEPVFEYDHSNGRCSITGGYVVRTGSLASELGRYVYGDFCTGEIRSLSLPSGSGDRPVQGVSLEDFTLGSFGEDARGCLYVTSLAGTVSRIADSGDPAGAGCAAP